MCEEIGFARVCESVFEEWSVLSANITKNVNNNSWLTYTKLLFRNFLWYAVHFIRLKRDGRFLQRRLGVGAKNFLC